MTSEVTALSKAYDLTLWTAERVARFPRAHHYTVGQRMVTTLLDAQELLIEAHYLVTGKDAGTEACATGGATGSSISPARRPASASPRTGGVCQTGSRSFARAVPVPEGHGQTVVAARPAVVDPRPIPRPGGW